MKLSPVELFFLSMMRVTPNIILTTVRPFQMNNVEENVQFFECTSIVNPSTLSYFPNQSTTVYVTKQRTTRND